MNGILQARRVIKRHASTDRPPTAKKRVRNTLETAEANLENYKKQLEEKSNLLEATSFELNSTRETLIRTKTLLNEKRKDLKNQRRRANRYRKKNCVLNKIIEELKKKESGGG